MNNFKQRIGKTAKDKKTGSHARRIENNEQRAEWSRLSNTEQDRTRFPVHTCNGKKNRTRITGKKGKQKVLNRA
jgi:hypothetical protein